MTRTTWKHRRLLPVLMGVAAVATSVPAMAAGLPATAEIPQGGTLVAAQIADLNSLDPARSVANTDLMYQFPVYDTLVRLDPQTTEALPGLAASWEFIDPTTLRLHLVEDEVLFHDGTVFDAEAVKFSLERHKELTTYPDLAMLDDVVVVDDSTVDLMLAVPDSSIVNTLADRAGMIVSPTAVAEHGEDFAAHPVGTGPYELVEYRPGEVVRYEVFEDYWQGRRGPDAIDIRVITDSATAANALIAGEIDYALFLDPQDIGRLESAGVNVSAEQTLGFDLFYMNQARPPLDDVRVRLAVNHAINRDEIVVAHTGGLAEPAWLPVPSSHWAFDESQTNQWPYDPELARELLAEAGHPDGITLTSIVQPTPTEMRLGEIVQAQLAAVGIDLQLTPTDGVEGVQRYFVDGEFDMAIFPWSGRPDPSTTYYALFATDSTQNAGHVELPGFAELDLASRSSVDVAERAAAFHEIHDLVAEHAPYAPLVTRLNVVGYSSRLVGYHPDIIAKPNITVFGISE